MEKRRVKIKNIAKKMIAERGIARTTMKDIALACNIGRKTLYRFYSNIESIVQEIMYDLVISTESFSNTYEVEGTTSPEKLEHLILSYCNFFIERKELLLFYYEYDYHFRMINTNIIHDLWKKKPNIFYQILVEGIDNGSFSISKEKAHSISITIANTVLGLAQRIGIREEVYKVEHDYTVDNIKELAELLVHGVVKKKEQ